MVLLTGLAAYYAMENLNDSSGNGHTLTNYGATFITGKIGSGMQVYGQNNLYATIPALNLPTSRTFNEWIKYQSGNSWGGIYGFTLGINNVIIAFPSGATTVYMNGSTFNVGATPVNVWMMLTTVYSGNTVYLYKNGVLSGQITGTGYIDNQINFIGRHPTGANLGTTMTIDELGIWNRALTQAEITTLYNGGTGLTYPFSTGYSKKVNGITPSKVNGVVVANIGKVNGI